MSLQQRTFRLLTQRLTELPFEERLRNLDVLRRDLGSPYGDETEFDIVAHRRAEAMAAIKRVAEELGLGPRDRLTGAAFNACAARLGLPWTRDRVAALFDHSWRVVEDVRLGGQPPETEAQRRLRRHAGGRRSNYEESYLGLKLFLADEQRVGDERGDYDAFTRRYNASLKPGQRPLLRSKQVVNVLGLPWRIALRVARGKLTDAQARADRRGQLPGQSQRLADADLIALTSVAAILDVTVPRADQLSRRRGFPAPAATLGDARLWRRADIVAYQQRPPEPPVDGEFTPLLMGRAELQELLGMRDPKRIAGLVREQAWDRVPPPAGRVGSAYYWDRTVVAEWLDERRERD